MCSSDLVGIVAVTAAHSAALHEHDEPYSGTVSRAEAFGGMYPSFDFTHWFLLVSIVEQRRIAQRCPFILPCVINYI